MKKKIVGRAGIINHQKMRLALDFNVVPKIALLEQRAKKTCLDVLAKAMSAKIFKDKV